jgi:hypothetical protein
MKSPNLVALCVDKLDDTLSRFMGVQWDSVQVTHDMSAKAYAWKTALGRGEPGLTSSPHRELLPLVASMAHVCRVVRFIPLRG